MLVPRPAVFQQYQQPVMAFERFGGSETHLNNGGGGGYGGYGVREAPSVASLSSSATGSSRGTCYAIKLEWENTLTCYGVAVDNDESMHVCKNAVV